MQCQGGAGGNGFASNNTGGGGGGAGGRAIYMIWSGAANLTTDVTGGAKGLHAGTGVDGENGGAGEVIAL